MKDQLKKFLFSKHILVCDAPEETGGSFFTVFTLANRFGIRITGGMDLATADMIRFAADELGENIPEPFYRGFPDTVRQLTTEQKLLDQLISYVLTYGLNDFSEARHSLFEEPFERIAFKENTEIRDFVILPEEDAVKELEKYVDAMLASTRPLNGSQTETVSEFVREYGKEIRSCGSKDTAANLILQLQDASYARLLRLPDVIRFTEIMNYSENGGTDLRKLNLRNQQRKLLKKILDTVLENADPDRDVRECFEKRAAWAGLLHHIHYQPKSDTGRYFVDQIRNSGSNLSALSEFERFMAAGMPADAAEALKRSKGGGAVARKLNYILSRCRTAEDVNKVLKQLGPVNPIMTIQMLLQYRSILPGARTFRFIRFNRMARHTETKEETMRRRSAVPEGVSGLVETWLTENLKQTLAKNKAGKVYIDESMKKIALPLQEAASESGFGVLPRGTRLPLPEGNKLRCFTYWEKVDDIDLSAFGITDRLEEYEFSWRSAGEFNTGDAIVFSGDETAGYEGGSEYFDIDLEKFREKYPDVHYIVFADNVFSCVEFRECRCKAGYMVREKEDSGEIYEPKTVRTSFAITGDTTYALLFALDLHTNEVVWLNLAMDSHLHVAGEDEIAFALPYMSIVDTASVYTLFEAKATELVSNPDEADIIVSDETFTGLKEGQKQIHSYDYEKLLWYLNH